MDFEYQLRQPANEVESTGVRDHLGRVVPSFAYRVELLLQLVLEYHGYRVGCCAKLLFVEQIFADFDDQEDVNYEIEHEENKVVDDVVERVKDGDEHTVARIEYVDERDTQRVVGVYFALRRA